MTTETPQNKIKISLLRYKETTIKENLQGNIHIGYKAFTGKQKKNIHTKIDGSDRISR